ncbi:MAG: PQQ-binding-like beta-propeller repeat protein [Acidobacteria bacterium]|nr:PQQ-binding-like beta-propeller repeat protein [Acidobacteriota bacterium]
MRGFFILFSFWSLTGADWPQWRGVNRDGISAETGLLKSWPPDGPKLIWKTTGLSEGYSGFSVVKGRMYTMGQRGEQQYVIALDESTGRRVWETAIGGSFRERRGHGPRCTPTVDSDRLYALGADGSLACLDSSSGKKIWGFNMVQKFRGQVPNWGISESPLIDGDKLIVTPGGSDGAIAALDKRNGNTIWKSQQDQAAYSSPIAVTSGGVRQYVTLTASGAIGVSAATGELLWRYEKIANRTANIATPIHHDGHIFVSTDYGTGCALLRIAPQTGKASEVYFHREMKNHHASSVLVGKHLYGFNSQILTAMELLTGHVAWRDRSVGKGSITYADGHLYVFSETGNVALVEATPEKYIEKGRFSIPQGGFHTWTPPVVANGRLYLREQDNLYCYDIKAR